jgi:hypothetical protein
VRHGRFALRTIEEWFGEQEREMAQAQKSGFAESDTLIPRTMPGGLTYAGSIRCMGGIRVEIREAYRLRERFYRRSPLLALVEYSYSAILDGHSNIFRYDSPDVAVRFEAPEHHAYHHVHRFDVFGDVLAAGQEIRPPEKLREQDIPTIRQLLKECEDWYYANLHRLPVP